MERLDVTVEAQNFWLSYNIVATGTYVKKTEFGDDGIENLKIYIEQSNEKVDITRVTSTAQQHKVAAELLEAAREERGLL